MVHVQPPSQNTRHGNQELQLKTSHFCNKISGSHIKNSSSATKESLNCQNSHINTTVGHSIYNVNILCEQEYFLGIGIFN